MKLSELRAMDLSALPTTDSTHEAVRFSKVALSLQAQPKFLKVYHREQSFTVGKIDPGTGSTFYVVEDSTGIIYRGNLHRITRAIKACVNPDFDI